ncbi:DUF1641 domain-containing protein [Kurthia huakuii]|uniref:DUF1641 domain-containing protein n=1 Tax=Kurthia huakuii TaxID=1421019 RepID=UPI000497D619|nr:DUF1641 domain-containing protein [Kurthia huakuii]MBM7698553.1 uncharacterized protein YjgD (DUF1641 family) [Kurthia huakuii]
MATPITTIKKEVLTDEQIAAQKLEELKALVTDNEQAVAQIFSIMAELNDIGALEAVTKMLQAKEEIAHIALGQVTREPVTNMMNVMLGAAGALTAMDAQMVAKLMTSLNSGLDEAKLAVEADEKMSIFKLMKVMNDPDVNRAMNFGVHFLKGLGKGLKD